MSHEQRSFFRLDVMLPCSYRVLTAVEAQNSTLPTDPDSSFIERYFMDNLVKLDDQINELIGQIGTKSTLIANVLAALNNKVNFMLQTIDEDQLTHNIPQRMVNLSAGGLSFTIPEELDESYFVDVLLRPLKNEHPILARCKIVKIIPTSDTKKVALEFVALTEEDRRKLVYFIQIKEVELAHKQRG
jgi:c-di-GMP-binding flagellar brake protein YcgR